jgi:hypothetical protein
MKKTLVERLRAYDKREDGVPVVEEAADRIEVLEFDNDALRLELKTAQRALGDIRRIVVEGRKLSR